MRTRPEMKKGQLTLPQNRKCALAAATAASTLPSGEADLCSELPINFLQ